MSIIRWFVYHSVITKLYHATTMSASKQELDCQHKVYSDCFLQSSSGPECPPAMSSMHFTTSHHRSLPAQIPLGRLSLPYSPAAILPRIRPPLLSPLRRWQRCSFSLRFNQARAELRQVYCRLL